MGSVAPRYFGEHQCWQPKPGCTTRLGVCSTKARVWPSFFGFFLTVETQMFIRNIFYKPLIFHGFGGPRVYIKYFSPPQTEFQDGHQNNAISHEILRSNSHFSMLYTFWRFKQQIPPQNVSQRPNCLLPHEQTMARHMFQSCSYQ